MSLKAPAKLCSEMVPNGLHDAELWQFKGSKGAYEPISVPNVCSEHLETASLYLLFLALVEVFGDFRRQIRIQHVELL